MRTIDSSISVLKPSNIAWWHTSWTGRFILAALLIAAVAFVLTPGRTSAQATTLQMRCETAVGNATDTGLIADCVALVTAGEDLTPSATLTAEIDNWVGLADGAVLPSFAGGWYGVMVESVGTVPDQVDRVTEVDLSSFNVNDPRITEGTLSAEWVKLTALTTLNLSDNGLTGPVPRSVWAFFDEKIEDNLNLDGNPMLEPSPALNMSVVVSKIPADQTDAGKTMVTLSFDNIWYTTEVAAHEYRYKVNKEGASWGPNDAEDSNGWMSLDTGCPTLIDGLCPKLDSNNDDARSRVMVPSAALPDSDTYIFQVMSVKTDSGDDTVTRSESSQIDVVGPQTLTAENPYSLPVAVAYTAASSSDEDKLTVTKPDADADTFLLKFNPLVETEAGSLVTVTLSAPSGATSGSHTFPVEILEAGSAPTVSNIPNQSLVQKQRPKRVDLARYFDDIENLTFLTPTYIRGRHSYCHHKRSRVDDNC